MQKWFNTNQNQDMDRTICGGNMGMEESLYCIEKFNYLKISQHVKCQDNPRLLQKHRVLRSGEEGKWHSGFLKNV